MREYVRPIVLENEELAEGVYAASGADAGNDCYTVTTSVHQSPQMGRGDYRIQVNAAHAASDDHHSGQQILTLAFNQPVVYKSSNGSVYSGDGTATLQILFNYHSNGVDNIGLGEVVVESDAGMVVNGASLSCNRDCGQH